jgi:hypothetical protein
MVNAGGSIGPGSTGAPFTFVILLPVAQDVRNNIKKEMTIAWPTQKFNFEYFIAGNLYGREIFTILVIEKDQQYY